jgi:hypothetical protein
VSDSIVRVDIDPRLMSSYDIIIRGNRLYNRATNSFVFAESLTVIQVHLFDFDELPEVAKRYITIRAARIFQDRMVGSTTLHGFNAQDEVMALAKMTEYENEVGDYTIFDSPDILRTFIREGTYRIS